MNHDWGVLFKGWCRTPSATEVVAARLLHMGLQIDKPSEWSTVYRVQPKITGVERRSALCYWGRRGCGDIEIFYKNRQYTGIDLLDSVQVLADPNTEIELWGKDKTSGDHFLWVTMSAG